MPRATSTMCGAELPRGAVRLAGRDRLDHVVQADAARVRAAARGVGQLVPAAAAALEAHGAAERVRVGQHEHALAAVDRDVADVLVPGLEARDEIRRHAAHELHRRRGVGRRRGGEALARARADLDRALERARRGEARDALDRPEQGDDRRQVVRAHVEQRARAVGVEDVGVRVPGLLAADEHRGADRERIADRALVDRRAPGLVGRAEEDVRSAADAETEQLGLARERGRLLLGRSPAASRCRRACRPRAPAA